MAIVIASDQNWIASSGHAFEYVTKEVASLTLAESSIRFLLHKNLNNMIIDNELAKSWLREQVSTNNYDLYDVVL